MKQCWNALNGNKECNQTGSQKLDIQVLCNFIELTREMQYL